MFKYIFNVVKRLFIGRQWQYISTDDLVSINNKMVKLPTFKGNARQRRTARRAFIRANSA